MQTIDDEIRREITIHAPLERVWTLISEPGWWINSGTVRHHDIQPVSDAEGVVRVTDPEHGLFTIETVASSSPRTIAFVWTDGAEDPERSGARTRVDFHLEEWNEGILLRVVESGWAGVDPSAQVAAEYDDHCAGWEMELEAAKQHVEMA